MPKTEYFFVNKNIQKIINHCVFLKVLKLSFRDQRNFWKQNPDLDSV